MHVAYPVRLDKRADTVVATFPDIPEALTEGATVDDALAEARDCLVAALGGYVKAGRPIPTPSPNVGTAEISLPDLAAAKVALYEAARARRMDSSALALQLGCSLRTARQLLDVDARSRLQEVEAALNRLAKYIPLGVNTA